MSKRFHIDSALAYEAGQRSGFSEREKAVIDAIAFKGPGTDREIMERLGFREPNATRPRITALVQRGILVEIQTVICPVTHKRVRVVDLADSRKQLELAI
jgi:hypothetical protein